MKGIIGLARFNFVECQFGAIIR